jgi:EAL domain-containing protein (putative c-di-GMP-specific phosphodiesterase class I)
VVKLGRGLGMDIVAEGVETELEAVMMTKFGCTELQGFTSRGRCLQTR